MSELVVAQKKGKKWLIFVIVGVVLAAAIAAGIFVVTRAVPQQKSRQELAVADKFLDELEYEEAIAHYLNAIELNPANYEAYEGVYNAYLGIIGIAHADLDFDTALDYVSDALDVLNNGLDNFREGSKEYEAIDEMIDELKQTKKDLKEERDNSEEPAENGEAEGSGEAAVTEEIEVIEEEEDSYGPKPVQIIRTDDIGDTTYESYDSEGRLIMRTEYNWNAYLVESEEFSYDSEGKLVSSFITYSGGNGPYEYVYEYNEFGELYRKYFSGEEYGGFTYEYYRDRDDNVILENVYSGSTVNAEGLFDSTGYVYENGICVEKIEYYVFQLGGGPSEKYQTDSIYYDENGLITHIVKYDTYFSTAGEYFAEYEYNEEGQPIIMRAVSASGEVLMTEQYSY